MAENWNLADEFTPQLDKKVSVFDSMPSKMEALSEEEWVNQASKQGWREHPVADLTNTKNLNEPVAKGEANMVDAPLSPSHPADQAAKGITNPLETFEPVNKGSTSFGTVKQGPEGSNEQQKKEPSFGTVISEGMGALQRIKDVSNGRSGRNKAFEQGRDRAFSQEVYDSMVSYLDARGFNVNDIAVVAKKPGGGYRSAQEIDQIRSFFDTGIQVKDENGNSQTVFPRSYEEAINMHQHESAQRMTDAPKQATVNGADSVEAAQKFAGLTKSYYEAKDRAAAKPEDRDAQTAANVLREMVRAAGGPAYVAREFQTGQEQFQSLWKFKGKKVDAEGNPTDGLKTLTADVLRVNNLSSKEPMIPVVQGIYDAQGKIGFDTKAVASKFQGGKLLEGAMIAVTNPKPTGEGDRFFTYQVTKDGGFVSLDPVKLVKQDKSPAPDLNAIPPGGMNLFPVTPGWAETQINKAAGSIKEAVGEAVEGVKNVFSRDAEIKRLYTIIEGYKKKLEKDPNNTALQRGVNEWVKQLNKEITNKQNEEKAASKSK